MCKRFCKVPKLNLDPSEWRGIKPRKSSKCHWFLGFIILSIWAVWMAQDIHRYESVVWNITGSKTNTDPAIEISGAGFCGSEDVKIETSGAQSSPCNTSAWYRFGGCAVCFSVFPFNRAHRWKITYSSYVQIPRRLATQRLYHTIDLRR